MSPHNDDNNNYDFLLDRLKSHATKNPNKLAVTFLGSGPPTDGGSIQRQLTYQELETETTHWANRLLQEGLKAGDRAVLVYPPSLDFMMAFLACCKANIIAVPVFPPNPTRRDSLHMFSRITSACDAKFALTSKDYNHMKKLAGIKDAFSKLTLTSTKRQAATAAAWPDSLQWIVTDDHKNHNGKKSKQTNNNNNTIDETNTIQQTTKDQIAFLQFTSGSTSDPKGVMITQGNLAHNLTCITNELKASERTVVVSWLPQYHDMGLIGSYLGVLYCGGSGYYMSPLTFLQRPTQWIEAISKFKATHLQAPNFAFKLTARKFDATKYSTTTLNLSTVQHIINAAEPVDEDSMQTFYKTFGPYGLQKVIYPTYGLAEHTVFVCSGGKQILTVDKKELEVNGRVQIRVASEDADNVENVSKLVGCGYPAHQNINVKIVKGNQKPDEDDEMATSYTAVEEDVVGEIWVKSPSKAAGYYLKEVETKHDFHGILENDNDNDNDDNDGYLRTGDLGFLHGGELFICGRLKDLIIVGGRNYYPQDIEATAEATLTESVVRFGCSAAFTIDPATPNAHNNNNNNNKPDGTSNNNNETSEGEEVALVMELREVPSKDVESFCLDLANQVRSAINQEHSLAIAVVAFLKPRTVPKTSSGKIARAWCRKGYVGRTLQIVYEKVFKGTMAPLEIDQGPNNATTSPATTEIPAPQGPKLNASQVRALSKKDILSRLKTDVSRVASIPPESIDTKAALATMMDSLTLSQFKGMIESSYHITLSDDYLFRDSTSLVKLVEVVKLGYAPDDEGNEGGTGAANTAGQSGTAPGLAGVLGCPPGVVCVIL